MRRDIVDSPQGSSRTSPVDRVVDIPVVESLSPLILSSATPPPPVIDMPVRSLTPNNRSLSFLQTGRLDHLLTSPATITLRTGFGLRVPPTSLIHTNNRSNILPILLQHKYTLQLTNNSFHSNTNSLYIIPPAIHTANRIANKIVPLASKPITQVPHNLSDTRDITLQPARDV